MKNISNDKKTTSEVAAAATSVASSFDSQSHTTNETNNNGGNANTIPDKEQEGGPQRKRQKTDSRQQQQERTYQETNETFDHKWMFEDRSNILRLYCDYKVALYDWHNGANAMKFSNISMDNLFGIYDLLFCRGVARGTDQGYTGTMTTSRTVRPGGGTMYLYSDDGDENINNNNNGNNERYANVRFDGDATSSSSSSSSSSLSSSSSSPSLLFGVITIQSSFKKHGHSWGRCMETNAKICQRPTNDNYNRHNGGTNNDSSTTTHNEKLYFDIVEHTFEGKNPQEDGDFAGAELSMLANDGSLDWIPNERDISAGNGDDHQYRNYMQAAATRQSNGSNWSSQNSWLCNHLNIPDRAAFLIRSYCTHCPEIQWKWQPGDLVLTLDINDYSTSWITTYIARRQQVDVSSSSSSDSDYDISSSSNKNNGGHSAAASNIACCRDDDEGNDDAF